MEIENQQIASNPKTPIESDYLVMIRVGCCATCAIYRMYGCLKDQNVNITIDDVTVWSGEVGDGFLLELIDKFCDHLVATENCDLGNRLKNPVRFRFFGVDDSSRERLNHLFASEFSFVSDFS